MHSNWAITLEELDYVGPKNYKFQKVPKVLARAKPLGVVGGCKKFSKRMAMQSNCDGSSLAESERRAKRIMRLAGAVRRENLEILIHIFARQTCVAIPLCEQDRLITFFT